MGIELFMDGELAGLGETHTHLVPEMWVETALSPKADKILAQCVQLENSI